MPSSLRRCNVVGDDLLQICAGKCDQIKDCVLCVGFGTGPLKDQIDENGLCPGRCNHTKVVDELDSKLLL